MLRTSICLFLAGFMTGLAGCNVMGGAGGGSMDGDVMNGDMTNGGGSVPYAAVLDATQPTADVTSDGMGEGTFTLTADQGNLEFSISASNLTSMVVAAHFHVAPAGEDGPIVFDLGPFLAATEDGGTIDGMTNLDDWGIADPVGELNAGNIYVNIHTTNFRPGEIRGQVLTVE